MTPDIVKQPLLTALDTLELSKNLLDQHMIERVKALCKQDSIVEPEKFHVNDLDEMKMLVKSIQKQVIGDNGNILSSASVRDLASLTAAITSLIRLFRTEQQNIDNAKELDLIHHSVIVALGKLGPEKVNIYLNELKRQLANN